MAADLSACDRNGCFSDAGQGACTKAEITLATNWLRKVEEKCHQLLENWESTKAVPKVKIAILDTGVSTEHEQIRDRFGKAKQIRDYKEWRDGIPFTPPSDDTAGHGTHCTALLARVAPETAALIYVAKVAEDTTHVEASNVAAAITYATEHWKVDIITLSLGFEFDQACITEAIENARSSQGIQGRRIARPLIFAAASNGGNDSDMPIAFPARLDDVVCVLASRAEGTYLTSFSPSSVPNQLATLGQSVPSAYLPPPTEIKALSGTSMATPILAGTAAIALFFLRQELELPTCPDLKEALEYLCNNHLRTKNGITELLRLTSRPGLANGTAFVTPDTLFTRHQRRAGIVERIYSLFNSRFRFETLVFPLPSTAQSLIAAEPITNSPDGSASLSSGGSDFNDTEYETQYDSDHDTQFFSLSNSSSRSSSHASLMELDSGAPIEGVVSSAQSEHDDVKSTDNRPNRDHSIPSAEPVHSDASPSDAGARNDASRSDPGDTHDLDNLQRLLELRAPDSTSWFTEDPKVQAWLTGRKRRLLCTGPPGSGKSMLAAHTVQLLLQDSSRGAVGFVSSNWVKKTSFLRMTESLVHQFLQHPAFAPINQDEFLIQPHIFSDLNGKQSHTEVQEFLRYLSGKVGLFIVLDGVDELRQDVMAEVVAHFGGRSRSDANISTMFFSRPVLPMVNEFGPDETVSSVQPEGGGNLEAYINAQLRQHLSFELTPKQLEYSTNKIAGRSEGSFLIVHSWLDRLLQSSTWNDFRPELYRLPRSLELIYDRTWSVMLELPAYMRGLATAAIMWTTTAMRHLNVAELSCAVVATWRADSGMSLDANISQEAYELNMEAVVSACGGLLKFSEDHTKIVPTHRTVSDYVQQHKKRLFPNLEPLTAKICLQYISSLPAGLAACKEESELALRSLQYPFLGYAARYWGVHAGRSLTSREALTGPSMMLDAVSQARRVDIYGTSRLFDVFPRGSTAAHWAACSGLKRLVTRRKGSVKHASELYSKDSEGKSPLWYACLQGHVHTVKTLLKIDKVRQAEDLSAPLNIFLIAEIQDNPDILSALNKHFGAERTLNLTTAMGRTGLFTAALHDQVGLVTHLVKYISKKDLLAEFDIMREYALERGDQPAFRAILMAVFKDRFQPSRESSFNQEPDLIK